MTMTAQTPELAGPSALDEDDPVEATPGTGRYRSQVREVINRNTVVSLALAQGFNVFLPVYDGGVDFILHRERDGEIRKVQLKSRWTIDRKYLDRDLWIAFPMAGAWYLMPHEAMVALGENEGLTQTTSWRDRGAYSKPRPSRATIAACASYRFQPIEAVAAAAADDVPPA
ncbi:hypothetical protein J2847_006694 [Azospirillum agricola]|uniref:hypothetical protein n=1 Tax=Azospirillum agricola TaxID=1720247 RepID=UPI001AEA1B8C|nr:hypothetical protein [Azospirillum agricola]MBP2233356.1 hypothetical protein [Azospirillum agricola]